MKRRISWHFDLTLDYDPRVWRLPLAGLMLLSAVGDLASENVTLTTYYPAPSGVYAQMITTGNTFLARDSGMVGIGTVSPAAQLDVAGANGMLHVSGNSAPATAAQGAYVGWNALTGGTGETDFINNQGGGSGGFAFFNAPGSGSPKTPIVTVTGGGAVAMNQNETDYGYTPKYSGWSAYGTGDGGAAIYNDNGGYKTLMIVGNNSGGGVRQVSVWDQLNVNGSAVVNGNVTAQGSGGNRGYVYIANNNTGCAEYDVTQGAVCGPGLYASWQPGFNVQGWSYENRGGQVLVEAAAGQDGSQVWGINPATGNAQWMTLKKDDSVAHIYCCPL